MWLLTTWFFLHLCQRKGEFCTNNVKCVGWACSNTDKVSQFCGIVKNGCCISWSTKQPKLNQLLQCKIALALQFLCTVILALDDSLCSGITYWIALVSHPESAPRKSPKVAFSPQRWLCEQESWVNPLRFIFFQVRLMELKLNLFYGQDNLF